MSKSDDPAKPEPSEREAKLARALRANLRRRKADIQATAARKGVSKSDDQA